MKEVSTVDRAGFRLEVAGRIATLTLDRPPLNILDIRTLQGMTDALANLAERHDVGVLVLAAAGKAFSAGVDVGEHRPETVEAMIGAFHGFCRRLLHFPVPTVARVHGSALGGGCELALCCDLAVAGASAQLGLPEVTLGVFPPVAAVLLPRLAGLRAAAGALLWGGIFPPEVALRLGMVSEVVADDRLGERVAELASRAAQLSSAALRLTRRALHRGAEGTVEKALEAVEKIYLDELMRTQDAAEGLTAFMERRRPEWSHR